MEISNLKKELSKPSFLSKCCICHYNCEIYNDELKLKIVISHPKTISILQLLSYFISANSNIKLIDWDEQENYDFCEEIYTDLIFIITNKNMIDSLNTSTNSVSSIYNTIHQLFNLELEPIYLDNLLETTNIH